MEQEVNVQIKISQNYYRFVMPTHVTKKRFDELLVEALKTIHQNVASDDLIYPFFIDQQTLISDVVLGRTLFLNVDNQGI